MGYSTTFEGSLKFTADLPIKALTKLTKILGEDCREHPEWGPTSVTHIDLKLCEDFTGIEWNGSEKTYNLPEAIRLVIVLMQKDYPNFGLVGSLEAQGEDADDQWSLICYENAIAIKEKEKDDGIKRYIVVCESWEYNDEYYHQPDDEPYTLHSTKLYTKSEAEKICAEKNNNTQSWFSMWDDDSNTEIQIKPFKVIELEV